MKKENFTQVPNELLRHPSLSPLHKLIVSVAISWNYRSYEGLAEDTGKDARTIKRRMKELGPGGMNVLRWRTGNGLNRKANAYTLNPVDQWRISVADDHTDESILQAEWLDMSLPDEWELGPLTVDAMAAADELYVTLHGGAGDTPAILDKTKNNTIRDGDSDDTNSAEPLGEGSASDIDRRDTKEKNTKGAVTSNGVEQHSPTYDSLYTKWNLSFFADRWQKKIVATDQFKNMAITFPNEVRANSHHIKRIIYSDWPKSVADEQLNFYNQLFFELHGAHCWEPVEKDIQF